MTETQPSEYKSIHEFDRSYANKVMLILAGTVVVVMYIEGMLTPSLNSIAHGFGVTYAQVSLILSIYLVGGVAFTPIVGKLGDIYGKKKMMSIVLIIYAAAVSVTGFSPNLTFMIVSRFIQGVGMTVMPLGMSLVREEFPKEMVPKAQALISAMFGAGFAISIPLGSFVSNDFGWRMTYHTAIPFVLLLSMLAIFVVRESRFRRPETKIDYYGAVLLAGLLSSFVFALSEGPTWGWVSLDTIGLLVIGAVLIVPLVLYEIRYTRKSGEAILDFRLLAERNVMVANVVLSIAGMGMFLALQSMSIQFEQPIAPGYNLTILQTGLSLIPFAIAMLIIAPVAGSLVSKVGVKPLAISGSIVAGIGFILMAFAHSFIQMLSYEFIIGAGLSLLNASLINLIVLTVNPRDMGLATAMNGTFRSVGSSIGAPIAGSIMTSIAVMYVISGRSVSVPLQGAFTDIYFIAGISFAVAALLTLFAREVLGKRRYTDRAKEIVTTGFEWSPSESK
ncbi:MAG: MFS transporter [Thermoplasmataceae archaeon]